MAKLMKDELFEAQLLRAIGYAPYGGADAGECLAAGALPGAIPESRPALKGTRLHDPRHQEPAHAKDESARLADGSRPTVQKIGLMRLVYRPAQPATTCLVERAPLEVEAPRGDRGDLEDRLPVAVNQLGSAVEAQEARDPRIS